MMKKFLLLVALSGVVFAHVVHYSVKEGALYSEIIFGDGTPASYAPYEIYAPEASLAFAKGQTDARGVLAFLPDKAGKWKVIVHAGSDHGEHRVEFGVDVNETMAVTMLEDTPLYNQYGAIITGIAIIFGFFGILFGLRARKTTKQ